jgi:hypothetical protein
MLTVSWCLISYLYRAPTRLGADTHYVIVIVLAFFVYAMLHDSMLSLIPTS